jgi:hypothetical protein
MLIAKITEEYQQLFADIYTAGVYSGHEAPRVIMRMIRHTPSIS